MSFFSFSKKRASEIVVVFDITSGSIGGALFSLSPGDKPEILFSLREELSPQEHFDVERFFPTILNTLHTVAERVHGAVRERGYKPRRIACVFASPWYDTTTKSIHLESAEPVTVTKDFLHESIKKHSATTGKIVGRDHTQHDTVLAENAIIAVKLNGYEAHFPEGKRARILDIALFTSSMSSRARGRVEGVLELFFPHIPISPFSTAFITYSLCRDLFPGKKNLLLLRIDQEVSDVLLVREGVLVETASLPFGEGTLARAVAENLNRPLAETRSLMAIKHNDKAHPTVSLQLNAALTGAQQRWTALFAETLEHFREEGIIPRDVFVMPSLGARWFIERLKSDEYKHHPLTGGPFTVVSFETGIVREHVMCAPGVSCDVFLAEAGLFLNTQHGFFFSPSL